MCCGRNPAHYSPRMRADRAHGGNHSRNNSSPNAGKKLCKGDYREELARHDRTDDKPAQGKGEEMPLRQHRTSGMRSSVRLGVPTDATSRQTRNRQNRFKG